ncbi:MAG: L-fucokinase, partial [Clostridia bacterium]
MNNLNTLFLEQSYNDCREYTRESILSDRYDAWDFIVLTASNDEQAKNYNLQIKERLQTKILNNNIKYLVVPDCNGERIGSGGATLNVLLILKEQYGVDFTKNKVLIIHSGGDSKRIPQYSVCGKLFSPVQSLLNNRFGSTLFDELIALSAIIPSRMANGIMIMSGDAMLLFNPLQVDFKSGGVAAISTKLSAEIAKNHGVFLTNEKGELLEFLHKKSVAELCAKGATNAQGNVDVDTGIILFDGAIADKMLSLVMTDGLVDNAKAKAYINATVRLSFYGDFLYPLAKNATLSDYLQQAGEGEPCEEIIECRKAIFKILNKYKMQIKSVSPAQFLHFGTTRELFDLVTENVADYAYLGWKKYILSTYEPQCCSVYHASISSSKVGKKNYFENSIVENSNIGSGCIFSFVEIKNKTIPDDIVLSGLKMNDGHFVVRIYGLKDDPKQSLEKDSWLGVSLSKKLQQYDENCESLIGKCSLWMADIFPIADTMEGAVDMAINTYELFILGDQTKYAQWRDAEKVSFSSSFRNADVEWLILWQKNIDRTILIDKAYDCIKNKKTFEEFASIFENFNFVEYFKELLAKCGENTSDKMRLYFFASRLSDRKNEKIFFEDNAFEQIKALCAYKNEEVFRGKIKNNSVKVALPARVNFGGGWTDTPPYCVENGGAVLNASIQIAGELPIRAYVKKLDKREIVLRSIDSNESKAFVIKAEILDCADPFDTFALQKACLVATNVITESDDKDLANVFDILGGGFELTTEVVNIPKGSGLGTSSILAAACVKAIYEFF